MVTPPTQVVELGLPAIGPPGIAVCWVQVLCTYSPRLLVQDPGPAEAQVPAVKRSPLLQLAVPLAPAPGLGES